MFGALDFLRLDSATLLAAALGILSTEPDLATAVVRASPLGFAAESERRRDRGNEAGALGRMGRQGGLSGALVVCMLGARWLSNCCGTRILFAVGGMVIVGTLNLIFLFILFSRT